MNELDLKMEELRMEQEHQRDDGGNTPEYVDSQIAWLESLISDDPALD